MNPDICIMGVINCFGAVRLVRKPVGIYCLRLKFIVHTLINFSRFLQTNMAFNSRAAASPTLAPTRGRGGERGEGGGDSGCLCRGGSQRRWGKGDH